MPDKNPSKGVPDTTGKDWLDALIAEAGRPPWGPRTMVKMLLKSPDLRREVKGYLNTIENLDIAKPGDPDAAAKALAELNKYYETRNNNELDQMGMSKDNQAALLRCTDRNNLIFVAANIDR